jgi:hypothetical protein
MVRLSRRGLVLGTGACLVAAPFVALLGQRARADTGVGPKRLVIFFHPNGTVHKHWRPTGTEAAFDFPAGSILEPLGAHKSDLLIVDGIDFVNQSNHEGGMAAVLTGSGRADSPSKGASVDQFIAAKLGGTTRFSSLEFGVQTSAWGGNVQTRMSYSAAGAFVPPDDDPVSVYQRMFGALLGDQTAAAKLLARRKSVLDVVRGDIRDLSQRVGVEERAKLEAHLDAIRRVETGLSGTLGCAAPAAPVVANPYDNPSFPAIGKAQMDLLVAALACGMTRVASIQWTHTVAPTVFSWLGVNEGHHSLSHSDDGNATGVADYVKTERWYTEQFVYFIEQLKATQEPDGTGTLFDTTLVVWCKELGDGRLHDCKSVPFVMNGAGVFRPGRYVNFGGAPHQKLWVSVCQAMGLTNPTFGDPTYGSGPLEGLV